METDDTMGTLSSRSIAALTAACVIALVGIGLAWSLASPVRTSPDDDFHLASIWCQTAGPDVCVRTGQQIQEGTERVLVLPVLAESPPCFAVLGPETSAACGQSQVQGRERVREMLVRGRANDGLYPMGFYLAMSVFVSTNFERSVVLMRMFSWIVAVLALVAACALARPDVRKVFALACLTTLVPHGVFLFASTNPSGLAIASIAAFWCAALTLLLDESRGRMFAASVLALSCASIALQSRSDAGIYLVLAGLAAWVAAAGHRPAVRARSLVLLGIGLVCAVATLWRQQSRELAGELGVDERSSLVSKLFESTLDVPQAVLGSLGFVELSWLDTPMPALTSYLTLVAFGGLVVVGLGVTYREKWLALGIAIGAVVALPVAAHASGITSGADIQPRYVLPLLPVIVGSALLPRPGGPAVDLRRAQLLVVVAAVVIAHGAALHRTIRRYVTGVDEGGPDLGEGAEWWWANVPGPMAIWALGAFSFALAVACGLALVARRPAVA